MSNVVIYGLGKTGLALQRLLRNDNLFLFDDDASKSKLAICDLPLDAIDFVAVSPGVKPDSALLEICREKGIEIKSELSLCNAICKAKQISVTGTNGKTTTTQMIDLILKDAGKSSYLLGNGGVPFSQYAEKLVESDYAVLETSSFQLVDFCGQFYVSAFLNVDYDHLNYHQTFENYVKCKVNNFAYQTGGFAVFNADDKRVCQASKLCQTTKLFFSVDESTAFCNYNGNSLWLDGKKAGKLPSSVCGINLPNALCAVAVGYLCGVSPLQAVKSLQGFKLDRHRYEVVAQTDEYVYVNDSKATNVHAVKASLSNTSGSVALIVGGSDKNCPFDELFCDLPSRVSVVVAVGQTAEKMVASAVKFGKKAFSCDNYEDAVLLCREHLPCGGTVLFSPACASFDRYQGYGERGDDFVRAVESVVNAK